MNENGEMLADFCACNNMTIGGSVLPHRRIHKATWVSPDNRTENQIDHLQGRSCRTTYRFLHFEDRSGGRMPSVTILIPAYSYSIDWIMKKTTQIEEMGSSGLCGLPRSPLTQTSIDAGKNRVSTQLGLNINKTKIMKANTKNNNPITLNG